MNPSEFTTRYDGQLCAVARIRLDGKYGLAVLLGEALSEKWRPGDVIVFWSNGDHTALPDEFDLMQDLTGRIFARDGRNIPCLTG